MRNGVVQQHCRVRHIGRDLVGVAGVLFVNLVWIQRLRTEQRMRDLVLFVARVQNVRTQERRVQHVDHAQAVAVHLVLIRRADAAPRRADLCPAGRRLCRQLDHAVVRQDDLRAIRQEQLPIDRQTHALQHGDLTQERRRVNHHAVADHALAAGPQHTRTESGCSTNFLPSIMTVWPALWPPA